MCAIPPLSHSTLHYVRSVMASPVVLPFKCQTRLPKFAIPRRYDLTLKPDLAACVFSGAVDVHLDVVEATPCLVLNALDLEIDSGFVSFRTADPHPRELRPKEVVLEEEDEILVLIFDENLPLGRGVLGIRFSGVLNDHMRGFYRRHKLQVEVTHARAIDEIFHAISYKKGSAVIRMLQAYLGYDVFQKSLASCIRRYACQNAKTEDLWDALSEESGVPVKAMMETWTKQKGYPVVYVKSSDCMLEFEQSQFISGGSPGDTRWIVPVTLCIGSYDTGKSFLLESRVQKLDVSEFLCQLDGRGRIPKISDEACNYEHFWVKVNVEQTGFYRVKYDDVLATKLQAAIKANSLSTTEIWKLGWDHCSGENHLSMLMRGEVWTALLGILGHEMTCMEASRHFNIFLEDKTTTLLPPDIRKATYTAVMQRVRTTNRYVFESLIKLYRETDIGQVKAQLLSAMASCPDPNIVLETLNFLLSSEVRDQDVIYALAGISSEGSETAWSWLKANWEHISDRWGRHILLTHFIRDIFLR
ncbi:LOW QUALITY PROTEIN: aminopeptidase M1-like [Elaeis guineensis]|uniref:LOW QUALITY PROTEIN: aminopeptidase M1-like n=1 Tax=Elaeis guineensis var. tenera TaxID=51953 RepID=UPI003C6DB264